MLNFSVERVTALEIRNAVTRAVHSFKQLQGLLWFGCLSRRAVVLQQRVLCGKKCSVVVPSLCCVQAMALAMSGTGCSVNGVLSIPFDRRRGIL